MTALTPEDFASLPDVELRQRMKELKATPGWNEPLVDRLFCDLVELDAKLLASEEERGQLRKQIIGLTIHGDTMAALGQAREKQFTKAREEHDRLAEIFATRGKLVDKLQAHCAEYRTRIAELETEVSNLTEDIGKSLLALGIEGQEQENLNTRINKIEERLAAWMIKNSIPTGHGDTVEDLLTEAEAYMDAILATFPISSDALVALANGEAVVVPIEETHQMLAVAARAEESGETTWEAKLSKTPYQAKVVKP
jgi:chromosome segregation ATPase